MGYSPHIYTKTSYALKHYCIARDCYLYETLPSEPHISEALEMAETKYGHISWFCLFCKNSVQEQYIDTGQIHYSLGLLPHTSLTGIELNFLPFASVLLKIQSTTERQRSIGLTKLQTMATVWTWWLHTIKTSYKYPSNAVWLCTG